MWTFSLYKSASGKPYKIIDHLGSVLVFMEIALYYSLHNSLFFIFSIWSFSEYGFYLFFSVLSYAQ